MRRAALHVSYKGVSISREVNADLLHFSFREKGDTEADEIRITLQDRDRLWQGSWSPKKGDTISAIISCENWFEEGDSYRLDCGTFEQDEDELDSSASGGDRVTIKAVPSLVKSSLKDQKKTRSWEGASLERIAQDIAEGAGLSLVYRAPKITLKRVDQRGETDLAFLQNLAGKQGCRMKVARGSVILFEGKEADTLSPVTVTRQKGDSLRARNSMDDVYSEVRISYTDPKTGKKTTFTYRPEHAPETGKTLELNQKVENSAQAERVAKAALREKNSKVFTAQWSGMGNPLLRGGGTVILSGWGKYDGKYAVKEAGHEITGGGTYTSDLDLEKTLEF